uniref:Pyridoxal-dependent decarboxylase domain-containing protein 1 n=1 Tax=Xenopsylla cheopis TaxID=163159 RepID=A0A6M2DG56_XENCH
MTSEVETGIKFVNDTEMGDVNNDKDKEFERQTLSEVEFQASKVIERLEAGVSGGDKNISQINSQPIGFLSNDKRNASDILRLIEDVICTSDPEEEGAPWPLPYLDEVGKLAIVSHSILAYLSTLERTHLQHLNARISTDTTRWLSHIFRFLDCSSFIHEDSADGLIHAIRLSLSIRCPGYLENGLGAKGAPCLYSSEASPLGTLQYACRLIGLPLGCVRPVPVNTVFGSSHTMDLSALGRMFSEDIAAGMIPLLVVGEVGTSVCGHNDNVSRLQDLCRTHNVWLHLRGHGLAAIAVTQATGVPNRVADSITLPLGTWLGVPGLPVVSLYRLPETVSATTGLLSSRRLNSLPLWMTLQALGREMITTRLLQAFHSCRILWAHLHKHSSIRILSKEPGGEGGVYAMADIITKAVNPTILFEAAVSCVVFQFVGCSDKTSEQTESQQDTNSVEGEMLITPKKYSNQKKQNRVPSYYDKLNSWLGQILQRDAPQVPLEICDLECAGVVLRYCPLEATPGGPPEGRDLEEFAVCVEQQLEILEATIKHKETFVRLVEQSPVLKLVDLPGWAGLGGVRYAPEGWEALLTDQAKSELNKLNCALVESLRATDGAFSQGEGIDGLICVRFGMVTAETDVEELLGLVMSVGRSVQESSRVMDSMTEIVKKGIEAATLDLQRETEEKLWQEGILRHVPVVGRVVNWWSPPNKEGGIKGRSLNLTQGVVESTENIYRYHMQIAGGTQSISGSKTPPTPLVQTPVGPSSSPGSIDVSGHSRTSSHSSQASKTPV